MKYPEYIYEAVREDLGIGYSNTECDHDIDAMEKKEILQRYLNGHPNIRYVDTISDLVKDIWGIELD